MHLAAVLFCSFFIITTSLPAPNESEDSTHSRIVNGYELDITEVPYHASLHRKSTLLETHVCGATIIGTNTLLTAAHCVVSFLSNPTRLQVIVGTSYRLSYGTSHSLRSIVIHESYSATTLENDIALLVTQTQMTYSKSVNAIAIAPKNYYLPNDTEALVTGFGTVTYEGSASPTLLAAKVKIVDQSSCIRAYLGMAYVTDGMICASGTNPPRDACQGDSGGPLVVNNVLVGIVSWGEKCAEKNYPGVYTRVSEYQSWVVTRANQYS